MKQKAQFAIRNEWNATNQKYENIYNHLLKLYNNIVSYIH